MKQKKKVRKTCNVCGNDPTVKLEKPKKPKMQGINIQEGVKKEWDFVKLKMSYELKWNLTDSDFAHLLLEDDLGELEKQKVKK